MLFALRTALESLRLSLPLAFVLVTLRHAAELRAWPRLAELFYLGGLAVLLGAAVGLLCALLSWLAARAPQRVPWIALGVTATCAPWAHSSGRYLARSDTVVRRNLPGPWVHAGVVLTLLALALVLWHMRRRPPQSWRSRVFACALLVVIVSVERLAGQSQSLLVPALYGSALILAITLVQAMRSDFGRLRSFAWSCVNLAVLGLSAGGVIEPDMCLLGRAMVHQRTPSLAHLDVRLGPGALDSRLVHSLPSGPPTPCAPDPTSPLAFELPAERRRNVVIITIDTVRADVAFSRLRGRAVMPELSRFVNESWRAQDAYTAYPATMMALSSAFTGLMPSRLVLSNGAPPSLFGALAAIMDERLILLPNTPYFRRAAIEDYIAQGATKLMTSDAVAQTNLAIEWLRAFREQGKRHLFWLHYIEPHEPYKRHPRHDFGNAPRERYASELALVDEELGRLLRVLREEGWYDDSLVVVFSDHGESFGEHGHAYHHYHLFPWLIRVPFAMHVPGQVPREFRGPVHLTDVAATALQYVEVPSKLALDGQSLLANVPAPDRAILAEEFPTQMLELGEQVRTKVTDRAQLADRARRIEHSQGYPSKIAVVRGHEQLVLHRSSEVTELYDLRSDPGVSANLVSTRPQRAAALRRHLDAFAARAYAQAGCLVEEKQATFPRESASALD